MAKMNNPQREGAATPWGPAQHVDILPNGVVFVSTASHGGYYVPRSLVHNIPLRWQRYAAKWSHGCGHLWYEEDCCAAAVAAFVPGFEDGARERAVKAVADLERYLDKEQSFQKQIP